MKIRGRVMTAVPLLALSLLVACQPGADGDGEPTGADPGDGVTTIVPDDGASATNEPGTTPVEPVGPEVEAAVDDLAAREGVEPSAVEAGPLEQVTWSNGAIGCPQPGMSYTEALVEGYRVVLTIEGVEYSYHGAGGEELTYCAEPEEPLEISGVVE